MRNDYAMGTYLNHSDGFIDGFIGGRAVCSDGRVRSLKRIAAYADTFFSVPASVSVSGRTVSGYVSVSTLSGSSVPTEDDPAIVVFRRYDYGKNADLLPAGEWHPEEETTT